MTSLSVGHKTVEAAVLHVPENSWMLARSIIDYIHHGKNQVTVHIVARIQNTWASEETNKHGGMKSNFNHIYTKREFLVSRFFCQYPVKSDIYFPPIGKWREANMKIRCSPTASGKRRMILYISEKSAKPQLRWLSEKMNHEINISFTTMDHPLSIV